MAIAESQNWKFSIQKKRWWYKSWRSCPSYSRNHMQSRTASNPEAIQGVSHVLMIFSICGLKSVSQLNRWQYMWQSAMLTGLSSPMFEEAIESVYEIQDMFRRSVVDGVMEEWIPLAFQEHLSIDIGNRYFTPCQYALQDRQIAFSASIDPDNILSEAIILSEAMGDQFVHVEDNHVEYYEARKENGGTK